MPKTTVYELNLLENGLDFVTSGIEIYFSRKSPKPRSHKYAILHVFSGMLLLLKERLARIGPSLVFKKMAEAGQPGAKTTDYDKTFGRLEAHGIRIDPRKRRFSTKLGICAMRLNTIASNFRYGEAKKSLPRWCRLSTTSVEIS